MFKSLWLDFVSLIFPSCCVTCNRVLAKHEEYFCLKCTEELPTNDTHLVEDVQLRDKFVHLPIRHISSWLSYHRLGMAQKIIHRIKYHHNEDLAIHVGKMYGMMLDLAGVLSDIDLIVPIPLHKAKLKKRGFNQAYLFGQGLAEKLNTECSPDALVRTVNSVSQTTLSRTQRLENVKNVFDLNKIEDIRGKHILIVDDMITTGATLYAATQAILEGDPLSVNIVSIAYGTV